MDYHETDPERRNLVMLSLAFLIYFVGDGNFKNGDINFQIINLHLNNLSGIAYLSWGLLFWFFYRYMLKYYSAFFTLMNEELKILKNRQYVRNFVSKKLKIELAPYVHHPKNLTDDKGGWVLTGMWFFQGYYHISCSQLNKIKRDWPSGKINIGDFDGRNPRGDIPSKIATLKGWKGSFVFLRLFLDYCFTQPNFSTNLFPILLFLAVVIIGIWDINF